MQTVAGRAERGQGEVRSRGQGESISLSAHVAVGVTMIGRSLCVCAFFVTISVLVAAGCDSSSPSSIPIGRVADSGFRPAANGLPFQNYGAALSDGATPVNLTAADIQKMFGDGVCADARLRRCDLIPEAQAWLNDTNKAMSGGHCYGFSVLAELLWQGQVNASSFGATKTPALEVDTNQALQRQIAYDWALQTLESVQAKRITGTPNQILSKLEKVLTPHPSQTYTVTIWKRDGSGGHAVTPFEVVNKGGGTFQVLIYDNNWPDQTRAISFDTKSDTWTYDAASNPDQPESVYEGDAQSKTISLSPTAPGLGTQPCPFCAAEPSQGTAKAGDNTEEISLSGSSTEHATLIVTDEAGRRVGYINGKLVTEIPGARVDPVISGADWTDNIAPDFFLPADVKYTITLDGTSLSSPDNETLAISGPSYDLSVGPIPMRPSDTDTLVVDPDATQLSYTSSRGRIPRPHARRLRPSGRLFLPNRGRRRPARQHLQPWSATRRGRPQPPRGRRHSRVEGEPQDGAVQPTRSSGLRPRRNPSCRRKRRSAPVRQLDRYQPRHPPRRHP